MISEQSCFFRVFRELQTYKFSSPFSVFGDSQWVERLDWLRAAWGKLQPFRNILLFHTMGGSKATQTPAASLLLPFFPLSFQAFQKDASSCPTAVSGIKRYIMERRWPLHSHYHSDWSSGFCPKVRLFENPGRWIGRIRGERKSWRLHLFRLLVFLIVSFLFVPPGLPSAVRSSPRRRPYFSRK